MAKAERVRNRLEAYDLREREKKIDAHVYTSLIHCDYVPRPPRVHM